MLSTCHSTFTLSENQGKRGLNTYHENLRIGGIVIVAISTECCFYCLLMKLQDNIDYVYILNKKEILKDGWTEAE